jgi:hypothetical protein
MISFDTSPIATKAWNNAHNFSKIIIEIYNIGYLKKKKEKRESGSKQREEELD